MNRHRLRRVDPDVAAQSNLPPNWHPKVCTVPGCTHHAYMRGICRIHDYRRTHGIVLERTCSHTPVSPRAYRSLLRNPCFDPRWEPKYDGPDRAREAERLERLIAEVERRRALRINERSRLETEADLRMVERRLRGDT